MTFIESSARWRGSQNNWKVNRQTEKVIINYHDNKTMSEWLDSDSQQQLPWNTVASPNYLKMPQIKPRKKRRSRITTQHDQSLWLNLKWWRPKTFQRILFLWIFQQIGLTTSGQVLCCDFLWNPRERLRHVWVRADGQSTPPVFFFFFVLELKKSVLTNSVLSKIKPWKIWQWLRWKFSSAGKLFAGDRYKALNGHSLNRRRHLCCAKERNFTLLNCHCSTEQKANKYLLFRVIAKRRAVRYLSCF